MEHSKVLCASFSSDGSYLSCGFENGFCIYQCNPFHRIYSRRFLSGGIGLIEMLDQSNIVAVVGGGTQPFYSPNSVLLWDDKLARFVGEINVNQKIQAIRIIKSMVVIVAVSTVYVFEFPSLKKIHEYSTCENIYGLVSIHSDKIVIPGGEKGSLRILSHSAGVLHLDAHDNLLRNISLSSQGRLLATVSEKGTLIRLFNMENGNKLQVLRRGLEKVDVPFLCVSSDEKFVVCISANHTLHVFQVSETPTTTLFQIETKSISRLTITDELFAIYMINRSYLYLVSKAGRLFWYSLDDDNQLRLQSVSELVLYSVSLTNTLICPVLSNYLSYTSIVLGTVFSVQTRSLIIGR